MIFYQKKLVFAGMLLLLSLLLFACSPATDNSTSSSGTGTTNSTQGQQSRPMVTVTPRLVTPKAAGGSAGKGPVVISQPTPVPHGKPGSQQIVLHDRILIINGVSKQQGTSANSVSISLDLAVQNTSSQTIMNQSPFFQLMGAEGDIFSYQSNSSDSFYGAIPAHTTHTGMVVFQVPAAATTGLHLFYRPEVATETVIVLLKMS